MRKIAGILLILLGIWGIFLPVVPGDILILSGAALISPEFAGFLKRLIKAYPRTIKLSCILMGALVWGFFIYRWIK